MQARIYSNYRFKLFLRDFCAMTTRTHDLTIGVIARRTGSTVQTIRFYEQIGLIPPPRRTEGGHRIYSEEHLRRLNMIRRCRDLGFSLPQVRNLLSLADRKVTDCGEARTIAAEHRDDVRAKIEALRALERTLSEYIDRCDAICGIGLAPESTILDDMLQGAGAGAL